MAQHTYTQAQREQWQHERQQRIEVLSQQLEAGVTAIRDSETFKRYLATAAKFHHYSPNNVLLILMQRPDATRVAGYTTWKRLGRQVRKGEHGITIFAPCPYTLVTTDEETGEQVETPLMRYRLATVFDISQTDGPELPSLEIQTLDGEAGSDIYTALAAYAHTKGLTVTHHDPDTNGDDQRSTYNGYYSPARHLVFIKRAAPAQMLKTLCHELAHALDTGNASREECETVAEATAYMVTAHFGIDAGAYSFPYIAAWTANDPDHKTMRRVMDRIQQIAAQLIDAAEQHIQQQRAA